MIEKLEILYEDESCVVVNKPSGLLVHRSAMAREATEFALQILGAQLNRKVYPVHRLDRPTSGALIFAFDADGARFFGAEFAEQRVQKTYVALVRGVAPDEAVIHHPLKEELDKIADRFAKKDKPPQEAETHIRRLSSCELNFQVDKYPTSRYSLVEAKPKTGRKHQIRRHLKHLNHPIIGDVNHGQAKHNRFFREQFQVNRLLLACTELTFQRPNGRGAVTVKAPLAPEFSNLLSQLKLS